MLGVEEAALLGVGAAARAAVQEDDGLAARVAALFEVQLVAMAHRQATDAVGDDGREQRAARRGVHGAGRKRMARENETAAGGPVRGSRGGRGRRGVWPQLVVGPAMRSAMENVPGSFLISQMRMVQSVYG